MTHFYPIQIFYEDTDAGGIVYHANYLKYMERARTTFLLDKGLSLPALIDTFGIQFVVRSITINYEKPVRLQENFIVVTKIVKCNKASIVFSQNSYFDPSNEQTMICSSEVVIVCTNEQLKPCAIPEAIVKELRE
jgi:acyl-CoA thioester hydrolase